MTVELDGKIGALAPAGVGSDRRLRAGKGVVVLQHGGEAPSAQLLDVLVELGIAPAVQGVGRPQDLPEPGSVGAAILVGSQSIDEAVASGCLEAELDWIRRLDAAGATILGIGHGARALACAFGGMLSLAARPIRGWVMVDTTIPHLIAAGPWLTWQHDVIALPAGARVLAQNRLGPQAFRLGRHLGIQFHPEATPRTVTAWAARAGGRVDPHELLSTTERDAVAAAVCTRRLLSSFVDLLWGVGGLDAYPAIEV